MMMRPSSMSDGDEESKNDNSSNSSTSNRRRKNSYNELDQNSPLPLMMDDNDGHHLNETPAKKSSILQTLPQELDLEKDDNDGSGNKRKTKSSRSTYKLRDPEEGVEVVVDPNDDNSARRSRKRRPNRLSNRLPKGRIIDSITFRKRRDDEDFLFWSLVLTGSFLALGILGCITFYLASTDFFTAHQTELLGTTVDERFTVVSQMDTTAQIYLKSGYTNVPRTEAVLALERGVLKIGRTSVPTSDDNQDFYGMKLFNNGTVSCTNEIKTPSVTADSIRANTALIFKDGTSMTTAADVSGGIEQTGDLNFASVKGAIISSVKGHERFKVTNDGLVVVTDPSAAPPLDPSTNGIVLDGERHSITLGNDLKIKSEAVASFSSQIPLHFNSQVLLVGGETSTVGKVVIKPPDLNESDARKDTTLEISGQAREKSVGGDVSISGGRGVTAGGRVLISGGRYDDDNKRGSVEINTGMEENSVETKLVIGSQSLLSQTRIDGDVGINVGNTTTTTSNTKLTIGSATYFTGSLLDISSASSVRIGASVTTLDGDNVQIQSKSAHVGDLQKTSSAQVAGTNVSITTGSALSVRSHGVNSTIEINGEGVVTIDASKKMVFGSASNVSLTTVKGRVQVGENTEIQVWDGSTHVGGKKLLLGSADTQVLTLRALKAHLGTKATDITIGSSNVTNNIDIQSANVSITSTSGGGNTTIGSSGSTVINGNLSLSIGEESPVVSVGGSTLTASTSIASNDVVEVKGKTIKVESTNDEDNSISLSGSKIQIGNEGDDDGSEVYIGKEGGSVHLIGDSVTINGRELGESRSRRLDNARSESEFAVMNGREGVLFQSSLKRTTTDFIASSFYTNTESTFKDSENRIEMIQQRTGGGNVYAQVSFSINGLRGIMTGFKKLDKMETVLFQCRVYQNENILMEVSAPIEIITAESDKLFPTASGTEILLLETTGESTFETKCFTDFSFIDRVLYDRFSLSILLLQ